MDSNKLLTKNSGNHSNTKGGRNSNSGGVMMSNNIMMNSTIGAGTMNSKR